MTDVYFLEGTKQKLNDALNKSICICPLCTKNDKDMVFIDFHETWYCIQCQDEERIWYPAMGSEEDRRQHDYINWYYEQKERFEKMYYNKEKQIMKD